MTRNANLIGSAWMITAMAVFALEDALIKAASENLPLGQIFIMFGLGGAVVFSIVAIAGKESLFHPDVLSKPMLIRAFFEINGRLFFFLAIILMPMSTATVILQAAPIFVVAGAVFVFGEQVGWRRWTAIVMGLVGVIIVIRPGTDSFSSLSLLAVIGMFGLVGRDLASRAAPATISTTLLGFYGFLSIIVAGVVFSLWDGIKIIRLSAYDATLIVSIIIAGVIAYTCLMKAMRTGEVSAVTPFRYSRLLFGVALGLIVFDEQIDSVVIFGSSLIVLAGLLLVKLRKG